MAENTKLSSLITVGRYRALETAENRKELSRFIVDRFDERYFHPIEKSPIKHGFTTLAIACLVIETLESFYLGHADTKGKSKEMFRSFFARDTDLQVFADKDDWFYKDIRCGILHQSESRGGWRVIRRGPLLDAKNKSINATAFLHALQRAVRNYANQLQTDNTVWTNFKKKMIAVCDNCN